MTGHLDPAVIADMHHDLAVPAHTAMITFEHGQYSVPHTLLGATV